MKKMYSSMMKQEEKMYSSRMKYEKKLIWRLNMKKNKYPIGDT